MRPDSRARPSGGAGVRRFRGALSLVALGLLILPAACATTVVGSPAPAVTMVPSAPSPVPRSSTTAVEPSVVSSPGHSDAATSTPSTTEPAIPSGGSPTVTVPSDPSTEILTVVSTSAASSARSTAATSGLTSRAPGHTSAHRGTAKADQYGIVVAAGTPKRQAEIYAEPICPPCGTFEQTFGPALDDAIGAGDLAVHYRTLHFLDPTSASGDYSTRAAAALFCVVSEAGSQPGLFQDYYATLFDPKHQPKEGAATDLTDDQLSKLAAGVGAPDAALDCIRKGHKVPDATAAAAASQAALARAGGAGTPFVTSKGKVVDHNDPQWLDDLLAG